MIRFPVRHGSYRHPLLVLGVYTILTLILTYPLVTQFGSAIPGDGFDGWQNYWNLWWMKVATLEQVRWPFFTDLLFYPTGVSLQFHTLNPINGLVALPVQLAFGLFAAYNVVVLFSFAVGGFGAYLLASYVLSGAMEQKRRRDGKPEAAGYFDESGALPSGLASCGPRLPCADLRAQIAPLIAGLVYTFAPFHFAHLLGHMQVLYLQWIPFYVLYLLRLTAVSDSGHRIGDAAPLPGPSHRPASGAGPNRLGGRFEMSGVSRSAAKASVFLVLVGLCDWYYLFYCLLFTALLVAYLAIRRHLNTRLALGLLIVGVMSLMLLSPLIVPMVMEARQYEFMVPDPGQTRTLSADLMAFFTPQEFHPLWGAIATEWSGAYSGSTSERLVFAGYVPLLLALVAGLPWRHREAVDAHGKRRSLPSRSLWWSSLALFWVLAMGPVLHIGGRTQLLPGGNEIALPYALLHRFVPFLNISRSVSRFDVMVMLSLAQLAALGSARVMGLCRAVADGSQPRSWRLVAGPTTGLLAAGLIMFEFCAAPYPMSAPDTPAWYQGLAAEPGDFAVLNLPMNWDRPGYLLYQTVHGKPLTSAYISRNDPRTLVERVPVLQSLRHLGPDVLEVDVAQAGPSILDYLGVRYVVLDRFKMPAGGEERTVTERLAAELLSVQEMVFADDRLTVYAMNRQPSPVPFLILGDGWGARVLEGQQPWRTVEPHSTLLVHASRASAVQLSLLARAPGEVELSLWSGVSMVGQFAVLTEPQSFESDWMTIPAGDTVLQLRSPSEGSTISLSRLRIRSNDIY